MKGAGDEVWAAFNLRCFPVFLGSQLLAGSAFSLSATLAGGEVSVPTASTAPVRFAGRVRPAGDGQAAPIDILVCAWGSHPANC